MTNGWFVLMLNLVFITLSFVTVNATLIGCGEDVHSARNVRHASEGGAAAQSTTTNQPSAATPNQGTNVTGNNSQPALTTTPVVPKGPMILVATGGWNSCKEAAGSDIVSPLGMNMYQGFKRVIAESIQYPNGMMYFAACMTMDWRELRVYRSDQPQNLRTMSPQSFTSEIGLFASSGNSPVQIIGHSYGGWLAMSLAKNIPASVQVRQLITIDPISPITCTPESLTGAISAKLGDIFSSRPGYNTSPDDLTPQFRVDLRRRLNAWHNFYQFDALNVLHGTAIQEAENHYIKMDLARTINGHINLGLDQSVWTTISQLIR